VTPLCGALGCAALCGALVCGAVLGASSAHAQSRTSSLSWVRLDGAETCIAGPDLARAVEARLARSVFVATPTAEIVVEGRAERVGVGAAARWRAVLHITDTSGALVGDRIVESGAASCDELGRIAAVAIALMIDPVTAPRSDTPPPDVTPPDTPPSDTPPPDVTSPDTTPPDTAPPDVTPPDTTPPEETPPAPPASGWRFEVDVALLAALGVVPGLGLGGQSTFVIVPPGFVPLIVEGTLIPFARSESAGARVDFLRVVGGVQICPLALRGARVALRGCVGADIGAMFVLDASVALREREKVLVNGHLAVVGTWRAAGPFLLRAGLHLLVPFRGVAFTREDTGAEVYAPGIVAGMVDLGVGVEF
jgi:hypothetical protein